MVIHLSEVLAYSKYSMKIFVCIIIFVFYQFQLELK